MKTVAALAVLWVLLPVIALAQDGYTRIEKPVVPELEPGQVEVIEFFWYGCGHCNSFEPYLNSWLERIPENVVFRRVPAMLARGWITHGRAYFASAQLGRLDTLHSRMFAEIHDSRKRLSTEKSLRKFYVAHGVDPKDFKQAYHSDTVQEQVEAAVLLAKRLGINAVPMMTVNGKYLVSARTAGGTEQILDVVNRLIHKETRASRQDQDTE